MRKIHKAYGPYTHTDGRCHMIVVHTDGSRRTISYPKYLMEQHLGRELDDSETVTYKDGKVSNNDISNFEIVTRDIGQYDQVPICWHSKLSDCVRYYSGSSYGSFFDQAEDVSYSL